MTQARTARSRRGAGAAGLLLAVWFGLGLQPCAMAGGDDHDCPHCPPAETGDDHAHHARQGPQHDPHAGHASPAPCGAMQADCCEPGMANVDSRISDSRLKGDSVPALAAQPLYCSLAPVYSPDNDRVADPPRSPVVSITLHKLHCVYLD